MVCSILYFDKNQKDCQDFYQQQQEVIARKLGPGGSRNISLASSLDELIRKNPNPEIAFFDLYLGTEYQPEALAAAQWLHGQHTEVSKRFSTNGIYTLVHPLLLPSTLPTEVQQALHESVIHRLIPKDFYATIKMELIIDEHERYHLL